MYTGINCEIHKEISTKSDILKTKEKLKIMRIDCR